MGEGARGFRVGFGITSGCCFAAIVIPLACFLFVTMCTVEGARQTAKSLRGDGAALEAERQQRKAMRVAGVETTSSLAQSFRDSRDMSSAQEPLKVAVREAMTGHEQGEVLMLESLGDISKGRLIGDVMQVYDAPTHRGSTNDISGFAQGWPDLEYYCYEGAGVTVLTRNGVVDLVLVGLTCSAAK